MIGIADDAATFKQMMAEKQALQKCGAAGAFGIRRF